MRLIFHYLIERDDAGTRRRLASKNAFESATLLGSTTLIYTKLCSAVVNNHDDPTCVVSDIVGGNMPKKIPNTQLRTEAQRDLHHSQLDHLKWQLELNIESSRDIFYAFLHEHRIDCNLCDTYEFRTSHFLSREHRFLSIQRGFWNKTVGYPLRFLGSDCSDRVRFIRLHRSTSADAVQNRFPKIMV